MRTSSKPKIFIDGQAGTTGLMINERLAGRDDISLLTIDPQLRKDREEKKKMINEADLVFLCLPDGAARESAALVDNGTTRVIDASTAHRTHSNWTYGFPELEKGNREKIAGSRFVSNPGCHASCFVSLVAPLVGAGVIPEDALLTCQSLTGYSGAGKKLIKKYADPNEDRDFKEGPHHYALGLTHKHLPEMQQHGCLKSAPLFLPLVGPFYKGMVVTVPLFKEQTCGIGSPEELRDILASHYEGETFVRVLPFGWQEDFIDGIFFHPQGCNDTNRLDIFVYGHKDQMVVTARLDNLGKGASGAAVQNMNIMLGLEETSGLVTGLESNE